MWPPSELMGGSLPKLLEDTAYFARDLLPVGTVCRPTEVGCEDFIAYQIWEATPHW